jgi:site-specific recombinase XerD
MTLRDAINQYIAWRQAHGAKYESGSTILRVFLKTVNGETDCNAVTKEQALGFLAGNGPLTRYRENKHGALAGFYRYAISRGYVTRSPLPDNEPKPPASAPPHIYSRDELRLLFDLDAIVVSRRSAVQLDATTLRILLVLLYGSGLRVGEATRLTLADVDLPEAVLTIRGTKFYKNRLVPIGPHLTDVLTSYMPLRASRPLPQGPDSLFLANRDGTMLTSSTIHFAFDNLRRTVGIHGATGARQLPRLHDFRHSFAVHRLTDWYRQGADVQRLLPVLSTYLGHTDLTGTQVYLSMTPELLQQASSRFERYVSGGVDA